MTFRTGGILRREDVIELIRVDLPDYTEGAFDVKTASDDGGTHITILIEDHTNAQQILRSFGDRFRGHRIIVVKVPVGYLTYLRTKKGQRD